MADVAERGQLILVMGLVLAVVLVMLVPLLNTIIYTENLASRGTDVGGADAIEAREVVTAGVAGLVERENNESYSSRSDLEQNVTAGLETYNLVVLRTRVEHGVVVDAGDPTFDDGDTVLQEDANREFTAKGGSGDWQVLDDVDGARAFVVNVTNASRLATTTDPVNDSFHVLVTDGIDEWRLYVYDDGSGTTLAVQNASDSVPTEDVCSPSSEPRIDLTAGTVDGSSCGAIDFARGVGAPFDVEYVLGNRSEGTWQVTANVTSGGTAVTTNLYGSGSGTSPYWHPVVYAVDVNFRYETYPLTYRSTVRVVPEAV